MQRVENPTLTRKIINHLAKLYNIRERREGIHLSTLVYCRTRGFLDQKQTIEPTDEEVMLFALGFGLQDVLTPEDATTPVFEKDGITYSPDMVFSVNGDKLVEIKTTRMSEKTLLGSLPETWLEYIKGGCFIRDVNTYDLAILLMMGCLHPTTRVLKADLTWQPAGELQVGDVLIGVDEYPDGRKRRKLRPSTVLRLQRLKLPSYVVTFSDGRFVVASADHLWLESLASKSSNASPDWTRTDQLKKGSKVRQLCQPWETESSYEAGYLAGLLDGEGSLDNSHGIRTAFSQKAGDTRDLAQSLFDKFAISTSKTLDNRDTTVGGIRTTDMATTLKLLGSIRPQRLLDNLCSEGMGLPQTRSTVEVDTIVPIGETEVVGMDTTTKTLIAEGLVSHNSYHPPFPMLKSETLVFDDDELFDNWSEILKRKAVYDEALTTGRPPTPFQHCNEWECKNCRYKLVCGVLAEVQAREDTKLWD